MKKFIRKFAFTNRIMASYFFYKFILKKYGWFKSHHKRMPINASRLPIPWLTYSAIHFITPRLNKDLIMFEYGSGNSTIWFSNKVKKIVSVENNSDFYSKIKDTLNAIHNITYLFSPEEKEYVSAIEKTKLKFDIISIDGRFRNNCIKTSVNHLTDSGVILLDNSDRSAYQEGINFLKENDFKAIEFKGFGPVSFFDWETTIFYKEGNCLDI